MCRNRSLLFGLLLCLNAQFALSQNRSLIIQIKVDQAQIKDEEPFGVIATIRNTGATEEELQTWACGFPSEWISDNADVHVRQVNCAQDTMRKFKLKPGEAYYSKVPVYVQLSSDHESQKPVTFRLGFGNAFHYRDKQPDKRGPAIWSNAVTVAVSM